ncbi:hypothetical protein TNCV_3071621 [Trichonephila clavipes]|nr:hypothetical protein TNCV_3071621 [Trichonephila clavipes]
MRTTGNGPRKFEHRSRDENTDRRTSELPVKQSQYSKAGGFCEGDTRNRWRDGQDVSRCGQGTMSPWARRLRCVLALGKVCSDVDKELWRLGPDGSGDERKKKRKEDRAGEKKDKVRKITDGRSRRRKRDRTDGRRRRTEKRERRRKETERESGRERVKPALNGEKG